VGWGIETFIAAEFDGLSQHTWDRMKMTMANINQNCEFPVRD
jgi:hypothetical protein